MRKLLVLMGLCLISTGASGAAKRRDPAEILAFAVARTTLCTYERKREELDENHKVTKLLLVEKEEEDKASKLSLRIMFRPGRYILNPVVRTVDEDEQQLLVISFSPLPTEMHLQAKPEDDKRYTWAMNRLSGEVYISQATGDVVHIDARLLQSHPYEFRGINVFQLHELNFLMKQVIVGDSAQPQVIRMETNYIHRRKFFPLLWKRVHDLYTLEFRCSK